MYKVAIFGTSSDEQTFVQNHLDASTYDCRFYTAPIRVDEVDPATEIMSIFQNCWVTPEIIERLPNLRMISCRSSGVDRVDIVTAKARGIIVTNVPGYGRIPVAEYVFTLLLMLTRRMRQVQEVSNKAQVDRKVEHGTDLSGKSMGIVGTGFIGTNVARIARAFGMKVLAYDIAPDAAKAKLGGFRYVSSLDDLLPRCDVLSLHIPFSTKDQHMLGEDEFRRMKSGSILINTARGELVDTAAMITALTSKHLAAAGLDVIEGERILLLPDHSLEQALVSEDPLMRLYAKQITSLQSMPEVILTNHNAFNSDIGVDTINLVAIENIQNFIAGKTVFSV